MNNFKINIPLIVTSNNEIIFGKQLSNSNKVIVLDGGEFFKHSLAEFEKTLVEENNQHRLKRLEFEINAIINFEEFEGLGIDFRDTSLITEEEYFLPSNYGIHNRNKLPEDDDMFSEMFGYDDEISAKEKEEKLKKENKTKPKTKNKTKKQKENNEIKKEPEIIQETLNDQDILYCDHLKARFKFIEYHFERLYHSTYSIALFEDNYAMQYILLKFNNNYLLTNKCNLQLYKGENNYASIPSGL